MGQTAFPYTSIIQVPANSILGNNTGASAGAVGLTPAEIRTVADVYSTSSVDSLLTSYVAGPASSSDNAIVRYDGVTGKLVQNSTVTISDLGTLEVSGLVSQIGLGNSTFFGYQAGLNDDLTTNGNSAFGYRALKSNTTGSLNVAIGYFALDANIDGIGNTATGYRALYFTTGNYNTADGYGALQSATTGAQNTAVGFHAGRYIADGVSANITSSLSLFLGGSTKANADGESNQTVIGYNATGAGSNSVVLGNDSVTKTLLKGNVGIGMTGPGATLDVAGTVQASGRLTLTGVADVAGNILFSAANPYIKATSYINIPGGMFISGGVLYAANSIRARGGIQNDQAAHLTITGGTSNISYFSGSVGIGDTTPDGQLDVQIGSSITIGLIVQGAASQTANLTEWQDSAGAVLGSISADAKRLRLDVNTQALYVPGGNLVGTMVVGNGGGALSFTSGNDGRFNTFVGLSAGTFISTGSYNTGTGYQALYNVATTNNNTAYGYRSLFNNVGSSNTACGFGSLYSNTTGYNNVSVGTNTFYSNTEGFNNVVIGMQALYGSTTGNWNIAYGFNAGRFIADGATANTTGGTSVFLGGNTKALADGQTNQIVIGYNATGSGSNSVVLGNDSITTTCLKGTVIFNASEQHKIRVVTAAGAVTVSATTDFIIVVRKTVGAATTVNLPASPTAGLMYTIKDGKADAATNNITITPAAGNIDGAATYVMSTNKQSTTIVYDGTEWVIQ